ncbi:hypothetical protein IFM89_011239 [Coptis chinensis]|uniref:Metallo-beta-lactamase domain-containing protein n=1 Tax=Coptis chinensis TaxID=261450 RepID=A0A835LV61_9MAGN|nr:hypothetical protein IFM89_011239 [Coptis chinensis]
MAKKVLVKTASLLLFFFIFSGRKRLGLIINCFGAIPTFYLLFLVLNGIRAMLSPFARGGAVLSGAKPSESELGGPSRTVVLPDVKQKILCPFALLSCPTSSIHTEKPPHDILEVQKTFPLPIDEQRIPGVFHCGYHSERSYGATSYFIVHPQGNILVDSPRYTEKLAHNIEMLGGARYMFLTHSDDVADHEKWSKRLSCDRIIHLKEVDGYTADVEMKLDGSGPWSLSKDIELIHTPGHTEGSVCLFYKPLRILFTGDHLCEELNELSIVERYNRCSVPIQVSSVRKLLSLDFEWILPGTPDLALNSMLTFEKPFLEPAVLLADLRIVTAVAGLPSRALVALSLGLSRWCSVVLPVVSPFGSPSTAFPFSALPLVVPLGHPAA